MAAALSVAVSTAEDAYAQTASQSGDAAISAATSPSAVSFSGEMTLTSDYRFRGISQTNKTIAVQGSGTITHESGFYASIWSSSIDGYIANNSPAEVDLLAGYKRSLSGTTIDAGMLYYVYPDNHGAKTNFFEPYVSVVRTYGPISAKIGGNFAWKQSALAIQTGDRKRSGAYGYSEVTLAIPATPISVVGHIGHSFLSNYITFGKQYTDWSLTGEFTHKELTLSLAYVDTDTSIFSYPPPVGGAPNRNVSQSGLIGSIAVTF